MSLNREKFCNLCYACKFSCKLTHEITSCVNFVQGYTRKEYVETIKEMNIDIKKLCDKNGLKRNYMYKMLGGKMPISYKYAYYLDVAIHEKREYLPYITKFEADGVVAYE